MCKGSGQTGMSNQSSNQNATTTIPPDVLARYNAVNADAESATGHPFQNYGGEFVAPLTGTQTGAIGNITDAQNIQGPWFDQAGGALGSGAGLIPQSVNASNIIGGDEINKFMSPYIQGVVDPTTAWFNQQNALQQTNLKSNAISQGAFGGDRAGIASAVLSGQQNMAQAPTIAGLYNQGYSQALAAAQQQQGQRVGALQQGAGLSSNYAGMYGNLGSQELSGALSQGQAQLGAGTVEQQTKQAQDAALYNQFLQQQAYPFQTAQFKANIAEGTGALSGSSTNQYGYQGAYQPQPFFSDDRLKENVRTIGHTREGLRIIRYNHKEDPEKLLRIGFLASDVEKKMPEAVTRHEGLRAVDYDRAARKDGGGVAPAGPPQKFTRPQYENFIANMPQHPVLNYDTALGKIASGRVPGAGHLQQEALDYIQRLDDYHMQQGDDLVRWGWPGRKQNMLTSGVPEEGPVHTGTDHSQYETPIEQRGGIGGGRYVTPSFASGGSAAFDPDGLAGILAIHQAMYPGAAGRAGIGTGPRGMQLQQASHTPLKGETLPGMSLPRQGQQSEVGAAASAAKDINGLAQTGKGLYGLGKDAYGLGQDAYDWGAGQMMDKSPTSDAGLAGSYQDALSGWGLAGSPTQTVYRRGGRAKRYAVGGMPYDTGDGYVPEEKATDPVKLVAEQRGLAAPMMGPMGGSGGGGGGGSKGTGGWGSAAGSLAGAAIGSVIPGIGTLLGGMAGGFLGKGIDAATAKSGGRVGYEDGGDVLDLPASGDTVVPFRPTRRQANDLPPESVERSAGVAPTHRRANDIGSVSPTHRQANDLPPELVLERPAGVVPLPTRRQANEVPVEPNDFGAGTPAPVDTPPNDADRARGVAPAEEARAAVNQVAADNPPVPSPGLNPPIPISTPPGFRGPPGGVDVSRPDAVWDRMLVQESGRTHWGTDGNPIKSSAGAIGMAQVMPGTGPVAAKLAGLPWNPELFYRGKTGDPAKDKEAEDYSRTLGKAYYDDQVKTFGDPIIAGAAYNAGPKAVEKAQEKAARLGGSYLQYLPQETQNYVAAISGAPRGGASAPALNVGAPSGAAPAGAAAPQTAGLAPKDPPDLMDRVGGWFDRNERYIVPALSFLGNMLASPSRTLAGSIGSGMVGAAQALPQQQQIGQGQQRIDIAQRGQWMSQWAQLKQIISGQIASSPSGKADPALVAQMNRLGALIGMTPADAAGGAGNLPAGGPTPGLVPSAGPSGGGLVPASGGAALPSPAPVASQPLPAPAGPPTPTPVAPGQPADVPPSMRVPTVDFTPEFEAQLVPTMRPSELRRRAGEIPDPAMAADMRRRADEVQSQIVKEKGGQGPNGFVPLPSAGAYQQSQERIGDNVAWATAQTPIAQQRQIMRNNIEHIAKAVESLEPGAAADLKSQVQAIAGALGIKPPDTATMNADEYQTFIKNARNVVAGSATGDQKTDVARQMLAEGFANPNLQPKAVRQILAQSLANLDYSDKFFNDVTGNMKKAPHIDRALRLQELEKEGNSPERYQVEHEKNIAVRGATPDKAKELEPGQAYIVEPSQAKAWDLPGITKPTKLRFKGVEPDGRVRFGRIQ